MGGGGGFSVSFIIGAPLVESQYLYDDVPGGVKIE